MHCIGELIDAMPTWSGRRNGASTVFRARATAAIIRSEPMTMIRSTSESGIAISPSRPVA